MNTKNNKQAKFSVKSVFQDLSVALSQFNSFGIPANVLHNSAGNAYEFVRLSVKSVFGKRR